MSYHPKPQNMYDYGNVSTDPNDRQHRAAIMDGEYPSEDQHIAEQERRRHALQMEGSTLGVHSYPRHSHPASPTQQQDEAERDAYLRACHGGLSDAPQEVPQPPIQVKNLRG